MTRIAVLGANGQVGAELCLLLAQQNDVEVVPVCRSRLGSAYLRFRGIACRHGQPADANQAKALFGDCDVIANLALVGTLANPKAARVTNRALIQNVIAQSMPGAKHVYFSTMSVYGDAQQGQRIVLRNSYGQDKLRCEKLVRSLGAQAQQTTFIFRLGHVCGELQGISHQIRSRIQSGLVQLADPHRLSNTVYVATIAETILKVAREGALPGTYDLMNVPQWTWQEVFAYEARVLGDELRFEIVGDPVRPDLSEGLKRSASKFVFACTQNQTLKRAASRIVPRLPLNLFHRLKAAYAIRSAAADIRALSASASPMEAVLRAPIGGKFLPGLTETAKLLSQREYQVSVDPPPREWPDDLPQHQSALT